MDVRCRALRAISRIELTVNEHRARADGATPWFFSLEENPREAVTALPSEGPDSWRQDLLF